MYDESAIKKSYTIKRDALPHQRSWVEFFLACYIYVEHEGEPTIKIEKQITIWQIVKPQKVEFESPPIKILDNLTQYLILTINLR